MMTGQILGGSPVTEAARYQILIIYLIATCCFCIIFINVLCMYLAVFDTSTHVLRTDRFIEAAGRDNCCSTIGVWCEQACLYCCQLCGRQPSICDTLSETHQLANDPEASYGTGNSNRIEILTRQLSDSWKGAGPLFQISKLQYSVPKSHTKKGLGSDTCLSQMPQLEPQLQQQRVLCTNMNACLNKGEIGIVTGASGSGKSTLLRVLSGLTPMDHGDVIMSGLSLASCVQDGNDSMLQWRTGEFKLVCD